MGTETSTRLRLPLMILIIPLMIAGILASCRHSPGKTRQNTEEPLSAAVDSIALQVYADPAGTEANFNRLRAEAGDRNADYWTSMSTILAITRLMVCDKAGSDSVLRTVSEYSSTHPEATLSAGRYFEVRGRIMTLYGMSDSALLYFSKAYETDIKAQNYSLAINMLSSMAELEEQAGDPARALNHLRRALVLADSTGIHDFDFSTRIRVATAYTSLGNFPEADIYFNRNRQYLAETTPMQRFFHYSSLGNSLYYRDRFADALASFRSAAVSLDSMKPKPDPYYYAVTEANIGECLMFLDSLDSATEYINSAMEKFNAMAVTDINQEFYLNSLRGDLALRKGDLADARRLLLAVDPDSVTISPRYVALHYRRLGEFYNATADYRRSLDCTRRSRSISDSLTRHVIENFTSEVNTRYSQDTTILSTRLRVTEKEEEVKSLYAWVWGVILAAVLLSAALIALNVSRNRRSRRELSELNDLMVTMKMENVRNRLSPHFIFNVLNAEMADRNEGINNLIRLMRRNLELCNRRVIPLSEELSFIDNYIAVERGSLGDGFRYELNIDGSIDPQKVQLPSMMLQIFVENAVKHGLRGYDNPAKLLRIEIMRQGSDIVYTITNSSAPEGFMPPSGTGTGLRVISQTITTLNSRSRRGKIDLRQQTEPDPDHPGRPLYSMILTIPAGFSFAILEK